jgi:hypothetical protein
MIYKQYKTASGSDAFSVVLENGAMVSFIADPANTDYANFRKEILADEAQLQDAEGNTMTAEQAKTYVATLP